MSQYQVDEIVIWHSPHSDEDCEMDYRGENGGKAMLYNHKSGWQGWVPLDQIRKKANESGDKVIGEFGCVNCLYASAECVSGSRYKPDGKGGCEGYVYYD